MITGEGDEAIDFALIWRQLQHTRIKSAKALNTGESGVKSIH
jgi:hypothetical protein